MRKKPLFVILLLIFSIFLVETLPMAKAEGTIESQDIWIECVKSHYPPGYDGTNDGGDTTEDALNLGYINVTDYWGVDTWDIELFSSTARIVKDDGDMTDAKMVVYEFISTTNAEDKYGESDERTMGGPGTTWFSFTWSTPVDIPDGEYVFWLGIMSDNDGGTCKVVYNTGSGNDELVKGALVYPTFPDPLTGESPVSHWINVKANMRGMNTNSTSFNYYYGSPDNYIARRDIDVTFPSGSSNRELNFTYPKSENLVNITYYNAGYWNASLILGEYAKHDYNATHWIIQIQESEIASYGEDFRLFTENFDYNYNLFGLYSENGTHSGSIKVTSHATSKSTEYEFDGEQGIYTDEKPIQFTWSLSGGGSRRIYTYNDSEDIYIFTPDDDYAAYSFYIKDYTGSIGSGDTYLESIRVVNGTERVVERVLIWDTVNAVPLTLTIGQIYILQARLYDDTIYRFGYFTPGSDPTPTLTISGIPFSDQAHYVGEHVSVESTRTNATHIQTSYENLLEDTTDLLVEICYMNGTQVWNDTTLSDDIIFNWYGADNETDYLVNFESYSDFYGDISYSKALAGEKPDITDPPDLDAVLGSGVRLMISIFLIYMGFIIFSAYTATIGVFSGLTITYVLNFMNFIPIPIPWTILHALMGLLIMWALAGGNK